MCLISFTMHSKSSSKVTLHRKTAKLQKTSLGGKSLLDYVHLNAMVFHYLLLYFMQSQFQCLQKQRKEVKKNLFIALDIKKVYLLTVPSYSKHLELILGSQKRSCTCLESEWCVGFVDFLGLRISSLTQEL